MALANFQVAWKASTREVTVQSLGDLLPSGAINAGTFSHDPVANETNDAVGSHVLYHHVREALYFIGVYNMQSLTIVVDSTYVALTSFVLAPSTVTLTVAATQQLTVTPTPGGASNTTITTWVSSVPAKATVSATGLVTAVASGTTTVTATSQDGALTATRLITVS